MFQMFCSISRSAFVNFGMSQARKRTRTIKPPSKPSKGNKELKVTRRIPEEAIQDLKFVFQQSSGLKPDCKLLETLTLNKTGLGAAQWVPVVGALGDLHFNNLQVLNFDDLVVVARDDQPLEPLAG